MPREAEDQSYFEARVEQELAMANRALHPQAARAHMILAGLYRARLGANLSANLIQSD